MEYVALKRVRLYGADGRVTFKANRGAAVPASVLEADPTLRSKVRPLGGESASVPEPAPVLPPPVANPQAADDGPGAEDPAGASSEPLPAPKPKPRQPRKPRAPKASPSKK